MEKQNTPTNAQLIESLIERLDKIFMVNGKSTLKEGHATGHFIRILPKQKQPSENQSDNIPSKDSNNNQ